MSPKRTASGARAAAGAVALAAAALPFVVAGCGGHSAIPGDRIRGTTLTIYASVPLHGKSAVSGEAVAHGASLALAQTGGRIGRYQLVMRTLDDSSPAVGPATGGGEWDPGQTTVNAHLATADRTTIGYIGELNSGASAVAIPILNRVGIPEISPTNTAIGLTVEGPGAEPGEPEKYYPTGKRTYARVVPNDVAQAAAAVSVQRRLGCTSTFVLDDGEVDGEDTAATFNQVAHAKGLTVVALQAYDPGATDYSSLAGDVAASGANCVLISALADNRAVAVTEAVALAAPKVRLFATAGLAESTYTNPIAGGLPVAVGRRVLITAPMFGPAGLPVTSATFYADYTSRYGPPEPAAIFGYEAMSLMLSAIRQATAGGTIDARRSHVVAAIFHTRGRTSVLGTYGIDRRGDPNSLGYGVYRIVHGTLQLGARPQG